MDVTRTIPLPTLDGDERPFARRLPPWLKRPLPGGVTFHRTVDAVAASGVATVCEEARCPNRSECWSAGTATFMVLGDRCTRRCHFCSVTTARPEPPADDEPARLAEAAAGMQLEHVVITAVARDDLDDEGADHFYHCVRRVRERLPDATIEVLPADLHARPDCIVRICEARPDVYNHNLETVRRLTPHVRPQAAYDRSLDVFHIVRRFVGDSMVTKSGLMVGLGEREDELKAAFEDLVAAGADVLTIGQYLQPTPAHLPVTRYYHPDEFDALAEQARAAGFRAVASGPFVRSSYHADELMNLVRGDRKVSNHAGRTE